MPMMRVRGLGDGTASSAPGAAPGAFDFSTLPADLLAGAQKWMSPSDAFNTLKAPFTGGSLDMSHIGILAGVALVPLLILGLIAKKKRF